MVTYTYDARGNILTVGGSMADTLGVYNPLRYRGYVYDEETSLYYLQSRYYDPNMGRFLNADNYPTTGQGFTGNNMFSYCGNNPVSRADVGGEFWHIVVGAIVGVATQYISDVASNLAEGKSFTESLKPKSTLADYGAAALSGALAATGIGTGASVVANAAIGGATYLVNCKIEGEDANFLDFTLATGVGAVSGMIGGSGVDGARLRGATKTSKVLLETAVSPKKIAQYTAKITGCTKTVIVGGMRTFAA